MKNAKLLIFLLLMISFSLSSFSQTTTIKQLPKSVDEFIKFRNEIATTPEGGITVFMTALKVYQTNKELGGKFLVLSVDKKSLREGNTYKGYSLFKQDIQLINNQLAKYPYVLNSYFEGTSPKNAYKAKLPYKMKFSSNTYCGDPKTGKYKLFVACSGADSPRPVHIKKNDKGIWKVSNWNSLLVGVKPIPETDDL